MSMQGAGGNPNTLKDTKDSIFGQQMYRAYLHEGITARPRRLSTDYGQSGFAFTGMSKHITQYSVLLAPILGIL